MATLAEPDVNDPAWRRWGPYLAERAWGTVREDYSADGDAWDSFPHDHARSRAYRWNEDGLLGICDDEQHLCLALALWNGQDPILKERFFGLTGPEGNHGEDAKEYWWFRDGTPSGSFLEARYHYPQRAFPYEDLVEESARRTRHDGEYELIDTGVFDDDRYWAVTVTYAKAGPDDIVMEIRARNAGPEQAELHLLPTLWFRNTWSWGDGRARPALQAEQGVVTAQDPDFGAWILAPEPGPDGPPDLLCCDNESNAGRLWSAEITPAYPKDGINDHVVQGAPTVNPAGTGTKAAAWYRLTVAAGAEAAVRVRLYRAGSPVAMTAAAVVDERRAEADRYHRALVPEGVPDDEALVLRQALASLLWSKQFYFFDVDRWLQGDPGAPPPPPGRDRIRNGRWRHLNNFDVVSMPDTWEYPWYAAWDLGFHCVAMAHIDPAFAKEQLLLLCREWYQHPNGQLPAYEWEFGSVNPPVQAWAALRVFEIDGSTDHAFLARIFHKLLINFTWWVNREDSQGDNAFEGGFLGLDNIGPFDRSQPPGGATLEQADGTAWMATYCLDLLAMAVRLAVHDDTYEDVATKFFEHFCYIASAMDSNGMWDPDAGFYEDILQLADGTRQNLSIRSAVGLVPLFAVAVLPPVVLDLLPGFAGHFRWFVDNRPEFTKVVSHIDQPGRDDLRLLSIVSPDHLRQMLAVLLDEDEFLSPHGLRSLSRRHLDQPAEIRVDGVVATVDYEPGESATGMFGGNSNWRGPVWFPMNHLAIEALRRFHRCLGPGFTVELPTGSGNFVTLDAVADDLARRLVSLFLDDEEGRRPCFGEVARLQDHAAWHDPLFHEYFHGDTGAGLGASHQTGWTALVADLILEGRRP